jgi:hypothetical protein
MRMCVTRNLGRLCQPLADACPLRSPLLPQTGNAKDITMQAGKQRASLPLMRRFNEHSEKLLKASDSASARCGR